MIFQTWLKVTSYLEGCSFKFKSYVLSSTKECNKKMSKKKILFIVNVDWFFVSHRLPIALEAIKHGFEVHIATATTNKLNFLEGNGLIVHPLKLHRSNSGIGILLSEFLEIFSVIRTVSPDILHLVTIKPVLFGGIAARLAGTHAVVSAVSGLGFVFVDRGVVALLRRKVASLFYRLALGQPGQRFIFQNTNDRAVLSKLARLSPEQSILIPGSGVNLSLYNGKKIPDNPPIIMLAARLLADKGVREFVLAAELVKRSKPHVRFVLVGAVDLLNPASIQQSELDKWDRDGVVELWGERDNMEQVLSLSKIVVLPSYREGFPKVLIEAAACGRAVITTNVPGCRDAIVNGVTGLLVPVKCVSELSDAILSLLENPNRCKKMGNAGRKLAEKRFDIRQVVERHMKIYRELLKAH
jgi:glycosyltransferase involved in cell wall biosynthesis